MIKPIVNISKILGNYHLVVTGLEGVISEGGNILPEAKEALNAAGTFDCPAAAEQRTATAGF